jgi:hypothetical protein
MLVLYTDCATVGLAGLDALPPPSLAGWVAAAAGVVGIPDVR